MQLADREQLISEVPLGVSALMGTLSLTDKRLVVSSANGEESIPLRAVASIRGTFGRDYARAVIGVIAVVIALAFGSGYKTLETALNGGVYSVQRHFFEKPQPGTQGAVQEQQEATQPNYGRYLNIPAGWIWLLMLPVIGWGGFGAYKGVMGETELAIGTAAGELLRSRDGRRNDMLSFVEEAGKRLP